MTRYLLLTGFLFCTAYSYSQDFNAAVWHQIDTSIEKKRNLSDIYQLVEQLRQKAQEGHRYFIVARCYHYRVLIADRRSEDSFYFRNSAVFDSLLVTQQDKPGLQLAMHLLLAKRLLLFTRRYQRFDRQRYEQKGLGINYAAYRDPEIDSIAQLHFEQAKALARRIDHTLTDDAFWMSANPFVFLFKPDLFDLVISERINSMNENPPSINYDPAFGNIIDLSQDDFISKMDSLSVSQSSFSQLRYYKEWLDYQRSRPEVYYFIESLARNFFYETIKRGNDFAPGIGQRYEAYLGRLALSSFNTAKANGVYQLCLLWGRQSVKYFPSQGYRYERVRGQGNYDTTYRYHAAKALKLFEQNKAMLDSFMYFKRILLLMEKEILETQTGISMQQYNLPNEPLLAELIFKNAEKLYYSIVRRNNNFSSAGKAEQDIIRALRQLPELINQAVELPATEDHNLHEAYLRLDGLPAGNYELLFSHRPLSDSTATIEHIFFNVSSIAIVNNKNRIFVLDRKTGFPLAGAKVKGIHKEYTDNTGLVNFSGAVKYIVNSQGFADIPDTKIKTLVVFYNKDTVVQSIDLDTETDTPEGVYDKHEHEGLRDFYVENASAHIFTDRAIYRPGQTVHFKAIFLTKNKNSGESMVMSKENLGSSLFGSLYKKWLKKSAPELYLSDPFDRKIDTLKVIPNEYGSVSGSFVIPKTAATGNWSIDPDDIDNAGNRRSFSVEEYKRSSYEISIDAPQRALLPKDSFSFKVNIRSFAGAALNNVLVIYKVRRNGFLPVVDSLSGQPENRRVFQEITDVSSHTNADGELKIVINDTSLGSYSLSNDNRWDFNYTITAEAVDISGESHTASSSIVVSSRPVTILLPEAEHYNRAEKNSLLITTTDVNAGAISKNIRVKIYRLIKDEQLYGERELVKADQWIYNEQQLQQWFPLINISHRDEKPVKKLVLDKMLNTGKVEKFELDPAIFPAGNYVMEAACEEGDKLLGEAEQYFGVFDGRENKLPGRAWSFSHLPGTVVFPGDTLKYYSGNSEMPVYSLYHISYYSQQKKTMLTQSVEMVKQEAGLHLWKWRVPADVTGQLLLTQVYILNNEVFTKDEEIAVENTHSAEPEIIIEKYRTKLSPGGKETFSVSIKTKKENIAAELMTTLYDASLDKLEEHEWEKPEAMINRTPDNEWSSVINSTADSYKRRFDGLFDVFFNSRESGGYDGVSNALPTASRFTYMLGMDTYEEDVMGDWQVFSGRGKRTNSVSFDRVEYLDVSFMRGNGDFSHDMNPDARWSGDNKTQSYNAGEFNVMGVSGKRQQQGQYQRGDVTSYLLCPTFLNDGISIPPDIKTTAVPFLRIRPGIISGSYAAVNIKDIRSMASFRQPLIIIDGEVFMGDLANIDPATITQGIILKGADATVIYGSGASGGVLVLSTKGDIIFPTVAPDPPLPARKNFNETAFFFPNVYADKDGYYKFTFTMPESVTEWNWKLLAHTKKAQFVYAERKLTTQLPLMVQPNMPRLLYQGDRIVLQSRITNLDTVETHGKTSCRIEDVLTGEDITAAWVVKTETDFLVVKKSNVAAAFEIHVPKTQLNPVKIIISVHSQNFSDGEEHIVPILSPKILVRENIPFRFQDADTVLKMDALPANAELYGIGLSIVPQPQSALLNALPWLANYSFDCAEQTFNKLLAQVTAWKMMRTDMEVQKAFERARQLTEKELEPPSILPDELNEQGMPWLGLSNKTIKDQKQFYELLDTLRAERQIEDHYLAKLYKLQNKDGGLAWFEGGQSDFYISNYVVAGFGKLKKDSLLIPETAFGSRFRDFIDELGEYCDRQFHDQANEIKSGGYSLMYAYARSYRKEKYLFSDSSLAQILRLLKMLWTKADQDNLYNQALLIITTLRYFDKSAPEYQQALQQLKSIEQLAIPDEGNGIRWKELADNDDMNNAAEETPALLADAFIEAGLYPELPSGIIKWLLTAKQEDHWSSTKATAAVINLLAKVNNDHVIAPVQTISSRINNKTLSVTDDLLSGTAFSFAKDNNNGSAELKKETTIPAAGNLIRYYFSTVDSIKNASEYVHLKKEISRYNKATNEWDPVNEKTALHLADKIKILLTIETPKSLRYVYIDDKRAAAFEPAENHSGYIYQDGTGYYQSVRDAGIQFFADFIPSGRTFISYEMIVAQEGDFTNGPAVLQCMYKPELSAYSNSNKVVTTR